LNENIVNILRNILFGFLIAILTNIVLGIIDKNKEMLKEESPVILKKRRYFYAGSSIILIACILSSVITCIAAVVILINTGILWMFFILIIFSLGIDCYGIYLIKKNLKLID
jgi:hypothetical protein